MKEYRKISVKKKDHPPSSFLSQYKVSEERISLSKYNMEEQVSVHRRCND